MGCLVLARGAAARAGDWEGAAALGTDRWIAPQNGGQGFAIFDLRGRGVVGGGDLHVYYNTETVQVGVERVPLGTARLELSAAVRAEGAIAGVLRTHVREGLTRPERGFFASYLYGFASLKWLPGDRHSVELVAGARQWLFARDVGATDPNLVLPPDTWALEPRLRYTFWSVSAGPEEWQAHVLFPRITGLAFGVELGVDVRGDARPWGALGATDDARNRPGDAILMARQWLRAGAQLHRSFRVQVEQHASWGEGEDDLTRVRVGGMNPYVVPVPGLPWPALLCERLLVAQASAHWRPWSRFPHEFGVAVSGGLVNDARRVGALETFYGVGGTALFADLRFGIFQGHVRVGYALPGAWQADPPHLGALAAVGVRLF